jgi:2,3-bisphosphoglycerate-independent phosphoglycerate mutase
MKYAVVLGDGMADYPVEALGGRTPLAAAHKPCMDALADRAAGYGLVQTTVKHLPAGSDVANLSVLGYDPDQYYTGRGPLEAASMGVKLLPGDTAFRCNLITTDETIVDYSAGHITTAEAAELMRFLESKLGRDGLRFYPGISYRHLLLIDNCPPGIECTPPHDVVGQPVKDHLPRGQGSENLIGLIKASQEILPDHPVNKKRVAAGKRPANSIWPWGQGRTPSMPAFREKYGVSGAVISAVDLIRGLGVQAGMEVIDVPGATGYLDTDYGAKARYALKALEHTDFVFVHVEAPDEAGHGGKLEDKMKAIEDLDAKLIKPLFDGLGKFGDFRLMVLPDHPTPLATKTHAYDPVPYIIYDSRCNIRNNKSYDEKSMADGQFIDHGHDIMGLFIKG